MGSLDNSVCLNHPNVPASARCAVCGKPICSQCAIKDGGLTYCSQECRADAIRTGRMVEGVQESKARTNHKRMIIKLIWLVILAAAAAAGYWYYTNNKAEVDAKIHEAENAAQKLKNEAKQGIKNSLPGQKDSKYKREREAMVQ